MGTDAESVRCSGCGASLPAGSLTAWCIACALENVLRGDPLDPGSESLSLRDIPAPGTTVSYIGDYELLEVIASGGMGVVYQARQGSLNRIVALKLLLGGQHASQDFKRRFRQEAEMAAKLQHPNIVPIYEVGEHEGQPYFSMEHVAGTNLAAAAREQPLPPRKAAAYLQTMAEAISYAHQQGVLHRDLKPSNILLGRDDRLRITDFGLARRMDADSSLTTSGEMLGTPGYLPPEQASVKQGQAGPHSDVYALGAVLYYLLTGRPPFLAGTLADTLQQVLKSEPVPLRRLNSAIPRDLETICLKCLEKAPDRRYASAQALADDLKRFLAGKPILARPPSLPGRIAKWYQREPLVAGMATAIVLILLLGLGISTALLLRARAEKRRADDQAAIAAAVTKFLSEDLIGQASSVGQADAGFEIKPNLTLREALDRATPRIGKGFKDQPLVESAVRSAIGDGLVAVGETERALPQLQRSLDLVRSARGLHHPDTLRAMNGLGAAYLDAGSLDKAGALFAEALALAKANLASDHEATLTSMHNQARVFDVAGKPAQALPLFEEALKLRRAKLGAQNPGTINTMNNLAAVYQEVERFDQALPLFEEALRMGQATFGTRHPDTLIVMHSLAGAYDDAGKHEQAAQVFEETLALRKAELGQGHPDTLATMNNLARTYLRLGKHDQALAMFEDALRLETAKLGPNHPNTLVTMSDLAVAYRTAGVPDCAVPLLEEALKLSQAKPGPANSDTLTMMGQLARTYEAWGKPEQAAEWKRRLEAASKSTSEK